ncbi:MAG TPA: DNA-processing protein DprA [Candidatus Paceibacterota bacterium]
MHPDPYPIFSIDPVAHFPECAELPQPPKTLNMRGSLERMKGTTLLAIVGSRNYSVYGRETCESLVRGLAGYPITIVSGLALGIDSIAHRAALDAGLNTIAFPGSGLNWGALYPPTHRNLAQDILDAGGALLSEFSNDLRGVYWAFPERNRLIAGISTMTLVIEAEEKSGTLITARLATEYNKTVGAVPGAIHMHTARGSNWLLKLGAVPITESADILRELNLAKQSAQDAKEYPLLNNEEELVMKSLSRPKTKDQLIEELGLDPALANITFSTLEIKGVIRETLGLIERAP